MKKHKKHLLRNILITLTGAAVTIIAISKYKKKHRDYY